MSGMSPPLVSFTLWASGALILNVTSPLGPISGEVSGGGLPPNWAKQSVLTIVNAMLANIDRKRSVLVVMFFISR
jgi:hypothetical protein